MLGDRTAPNARPQKLVSIILPLRDGAETLAEALESLLTQTWQHIEVLVVDDHSRDASPEIAQRYALGDRRVKVIASSGHGIVAALRTGAEAARGEYLARMDADDISAPERIEKQIRALEEDPSAALCATHVVDFGAIGEGRHRYSEWLSTIRTHEDVVRNIFVECPLAHPTYVMRRDAYHEVGGYRESPGPEDYDLLFRIWLKGFRFAVVPEPLLRWRDHPGRLSRTNIRYGDEAFRRCKRHYLLASGILRRKPRLYQWGAGKEGKWWLRHWPEGIQPCAVVDVDPRKIGQRIAGIRVISPASLPEPGDVMLVVAVGVHGAREEIRHYLSERRWTECEDYIFVC